VTRAGVHAVLGGLAVIATAVSPMTAWSEPAYHPASSRVSLGLSFGELVTSGPTPPADGGGIPFSLFDSPGINAGYELRIRDWLAIAATFRVSSRIAGPAREAGTLHRNLDMGLAPHLRYGMPRELWGPFFSSEIYFAFPVGVSLPHVEGPPRRAFEERLDGRTGWFAGATIGHAVIKTHFGGYVEIGYRMHRTRTESTITFQDGSPSLVGDRSEVDHQIVFALGALAAF